MFKNIFKIKKREKTIKKQLARIVISLVVISSILIGVTSLYLNYTTANKTLENNVVELAHQASENISSKIINIKSTAEEIGSREKIADPKVKVEDKKAIVDSQVKKYGFRRGNLLDANGNSYFDGQNYLDREYFKEAMNGNSYISSPVKSKIDGKLTFVISAPVWENGQEGSNVIGAVTFVPDENILNDIVEGIKVSENSSTYLVDKTGTTIAYEDHSLVGVENSIEQAKTDPSYKEIADVDRKIIAGESGAVSLKEDGESYVVGYAPVEGTDNWGIGVMAYSNDFLKDLYKSMIITIVMIGAFIAIGFIIAIKFAKKIGEPLKDCSERLELLADGDLHSEIPEVDADNEIGLLKNATEKIVVDLRDVISTLDYALSEISNGNLNVDISDKVDLFKNDFEPMMVSINKIVDSLNSTLYQINVAGEQVASGSHQVSNGAQILAQGATEQSSAVEELVATITEVSEQASITSENIKKAQNIANKSSIATEKGQEQMKQMIIAMDEITTTSNEIGKIIKNIDDIAFQTNILALNAAVEAARAGEAGKGFAVVADEVRNLASKSAESAKDTEILIQKSITAVENGMAIVLETAKSLEEIVEGAGESSNVISDIAKANSMQTELISQSNAGVEEISAVVQTNSATSEESAAASEELSSQAEMLKELIDQFKLKEENNGTINFNDSF
ncbi:methyl-accepting chemotaxis protein [Paraclostridium bifermentans]|uniref:methyl-accepting chemotaxis protein n=1 Tax=Paraclostridium bifermentans TaxID=1490 RepID=UPI00359C1B5C